MQLSFLILLITPPGPHLRLIKHWARGRVGRTPWGVVVVGGGVAEVSRWSFTCNAKVLVLPACLGSWLSTSSPSAVFLLHLSTWSSYLLCLCVQKTDENTEPCELKWRDTTLPCWSLQCWRAQAASQLGTSFPTAVLNDAPLAMLPSHREVAGSLPRAALAVWMFLPQSSTD